MWFIMIAFFGTIFVVNFTMARFAIGTFGGTVVDNSYVASQQYNGWLDKARAQARLGWRVTASRADDARVRIAVDHADGSPLGDAMVSAIARHPLGRSEPIDLAFAPTADGGYRSLARLPPGRWTLHLTIVEGNRRFAAVRDVR
jgi:nitrogen fixation protein FixH